MNTSQLNGGIACQVRSASDIPVNPVPPSMSGAAWAPLRRHVDVILGVEATRIRLADVLGEACPLPQLSGSPVMISNFASAR